MVTAGKGIPIKDMRTAHASHEIIALHKFEKSYYLSNNKTAVARRADADRTKPGDSIPTLYSEPHTPPPSALR